ncbi:hypothetical protein AAMO2058_001605600 [Amorphochlora amoebiformis]
MLFFTWIGLSLPWGGKREEAQNRLKGTKHPSSCADLSQLGELEKQFETISREAFHLRLKAKQKTEMALELAREIESLKACESRNMYDSSNLSNISLTTQDVDENDKISSQTQHSILDRFVVVLVRTSGPVNLGLICRCMENFGLRPHQLRLVSPECDPNSSEARKFAIRSKNILLNAETFPDLSAAVQDCSMVIGTCGRDINSQVVRRMIYPEEVKDMITGTIAKYENNEVETGHWRDTGPVALVFGNEAMGLGTSELKTCNACVNIPSPAFSSFNLAQAVVIVLYVLSRPPTNTSHSQPLGEKHLSPVASSKRDRWYGSLDLISSIKLLLFEIWTCCEGAGRKLCKNLDIRGMSTM